MGDFSKSTLTVTRLTDVYQLGFPTYGRFDSWKTGLCSVRSETTGSL